jgi:hypothetical protein
LEKLTYKNNKTDYRKWGWFGTNFSFDARLRRYRVLYYTAIGGSFLILIWTSFSSFIVGTYFFNTPLFDAKNLRFLGFKICGWFGTTAFLGELKDFDEGFFLDFLLIIFNIIIYYRIYINLGLFSKLQTLKFAINFL